MCALISGRSVGSFPYFFDICHMILEELNVHIAINPHDSVWVDNSTFW